MRKRSKYRPRHILQDPIGYVLEGMTKITDKNKSKLLDIKVKNSQSMLALMRGKATNHDMNILINMSNIVEALQVQGFGEDYANVCVDGRDAIISIVNRAHERGTLIPSGKEVQSLNTLMELHDAQFEVITIRDLEIATTYIENQIKHGTKNVFRLDPINI